MDLAARRYARRILLIHAAVLVAVLAVVAVAGRQVYRGARDEVIGQAQASQQLLAGQTSQGIENYYGSILTDMDLLRRANMATEVTTSTTAPTTAASTAITAAERQLLRVLSAARRNPGAGQIIGGVLWRQLDGRASLLFACDPTPASPTRTPAPPQLIGGGNATLTPEAVMARSGAWLADQRVTGVGEFGRWGDVVGNLVCVPLRDEGDGPRGEPFRRGGNGAFFRRGDPRDGPPSGDPAAGAPPPMRDPHRGGPVPPDPTTRLVESRGTGGRREAPLRPERALVAVVPIAPVQQEFLERLNSRSTAAWLIDGRWTAMAASRPELVGMDMASVDDAAVQALAAKYVRGHADGCEVVERPFTIGSAHFDPAMVAAEGVMIGGRQWELFVATSLDTVDGSVNRLARRALAWGGGVALAVAAILASTALGLIRGRVRVERLRHEVLTRELAQARQIQLAWLPKDLPADRVDLAAVNSPASHISGDFYNWFDLPDGRLAITIGDVTGHGMSAAFLMATTQLLVRTTLARVPDPGACLTEVNRQLCVQAFNEQFVTMLVAVLDVAGGRLEIATAGHSPPLLLAQAGGTTRPLSIEPQLVLGVDAEATYPTERVTLSPGSALVLYTDGVVECPAGERTAHAGQRFGADRLVAAMVGAGSARRLVDGVVAAVDAFRGPRPLDDDLTIVAVRLPAATG